VVVTAPSAKWWLLLRIAVALVWLWQGLWLKVIAVDPRHLEIVSAAPFGMSKHLLLGLIGAVETSFAIATLFRFRPRLFAWLQILALAAMNGCGIAFAADRIPDIGGMLAMNLVFALAIWGLGHHAPRD
jgi:hypothetical protein